MPAGSPIDTATGMSWSGSPSGLRSGADVVMPRSSKFDVRILPEIAKIALGHNLEFLLGQLFHRLFARLLVGLDSSPAADCIDLDPGRGGCRRQHVAVLGAEQHGTRGLGNAAGLDILQVLVFGFTDVVCETRHGI